MTIEAIRGIPVTDEDLRGTLAENNDFVGGFITNERQQVQNKDITTHSQMAAFIHEAFGFSTAGSTTSYSEQGRLTGQSARRIETLVTEGEDFGNKELKQATEELFAIASFLKRRYKELPGESSRARFRRAFLEAVKNGRDNDRSIRDMLYADQRKDVIALLAQSEIHEQNEHFGE